MFDDEKIKLIEAIPEADMLLVIWIKLLTLAGKKNMNGYIFLTENIPYTDEMLATLFNRPLNTVRLALETFKKFGMIEFNGEGKIKITNWEKHQNIDGLERIRENARLRQEKHRAKLLPLNNPPIKEEKDKSRVDKIRVDKSREKRDSHVTKNCYEDVVFLTEIEYNKLVEELGESLTKEYIKDLSLYIQSKGKKYKSHYATILTWNRNDIKKGVNRSGKNNQNNRTGEEKPNKYSHLEEIH